MKNKYIEYEIRKSALQEEGLTAEEYEMKIRELCNELKI